MRILALTQHYSGCGYHRLMLPVSSMTKEKGRITDTIRENEFEENGWDIVVINRLWTKDNLFELREKYGFKLVVDVDDYWMLDHHHLDYDTYSTYNVSHKIIEHLKQADLVTCTHSRLAERVEPYNKNILICPNAIPYGDLQYNSIRDESDKVRLFWAGGISHEQDLKLLRQPISKLKDDVEMCIGGYADSNPFEKGIWDRMCTYFTDGGRLPNRAFRGKPVTEYYDLYSQADICLIPLLKTQFNQYKSNLKILEAAGKRVPVIVSAVHPYLGFPEDIVNYASDSQMWLHWIGKLKDNKKLRDEQGERLYEYCKTHYNFTEINQRRQEAFEQLLVVG